MAELYKQNYRHIKYLHSLTEKPDPKLFERHCHDEFEILYVIKGSGTYMVEGAEYPLRPRTLLLTRPYEFHYVCPKTDEVYERWVINFNLSAAVGASAYLPMLQNRGAAGCGVYFPEGSIAGVIDSVFEELDASCGLFEEKAVGEALFYSNMSRLLIHLSLARSAEVGMDGETPVMRVIRYINDNLSDELSLDELARRFFVSKYYLCHMFRKATGVSVLGYINTKRIAMARRLLAAGESATAVAYRVGFGNYSSFYRAFCKQVGHAPVRRHEARKTEEDKK